MRYKFIILTILLLSLSISFEISLAYSKPIDVLNNFYQASIDGDIDKYISLQDPLFLKQIGDYKNYFKNTFNEVKFVDYKILNPEIFKKENRTLIFYELKGSFEIDGKKIHVDNDMVAFLWKYDDWKVRWTITRELFEKKIQYGMIMDASLELLFDEVSNKTIREEMIEKGYNITTKSEKFDEVSNSNSIWTSSWIIILILLVIPMFFYIKNPVFRKQADRHIKKCFMWVKTFLIPESIKVLKLLWRFMLRTYIIILPYSKRIYKKIKFYIKKKYKSLNKIVSNNRN